jgi:hypothetical protein
MQFIIGLVIGAALLGLVLWLQHKGISVRWYEWLLGALGFLILYWTVHDFFGAMAEYNEAAARIFLWLLGTPGIILIAVPAFLIWWRTNRSKALVWWHTHRSKVLDWWRMHRPKVFTRLGNKKQETI